MIELINRCLLYVLIRSVLLEMMDGLDEVSALEESLMHELDSDLMSINTDSESNCIMQHMDIREPLSKLKKLLEQRLGLELPGFVFCLQGSQIVPSLLLQSSQL